jgi:hypothetical protein
MNEIYMGMNDIEIEAWGKGFKEAEKRMKETREYKIGKAILENIPKCDNEYQT